MQFLTDLSNKKAKTWYRFSVAAFYFIPGLVFGSWASRIPDIKNALGMSEAAFGGVLFFIPAGQITALAFSAYLVSKFSSRQMLVIAAFTYPIALILIGLTQTVWQLSAALFIYGIGASFCNIATNTQAVGVERVYKRSIMASFHGLWSLAGFMGGVIGMLMVALNVSPFYHFCIIYLLLLVIIFSLKGSLLPRDLKQPNEDKGQPSKKSIFTRPDRYILILGLMAFGGMVCEGTMFDWSSIYFDKVVMPPKNLIRLGYVVAMFSMTMGRFTADRMITRFGVVTILRTCGVIITVGLLIAALFPYLGTATLGFALIGMGVSAIVPVTYSLAGKSTSMLPGVAIATVSSIGFIGFLLGPPVIGFIAELSSLRWALGIISVIGLSVAVLAPQLKKF